MASDSEFLQRYGGPGPPSSPAPSPDDDSLISLDQLSEAYAELLQQGKQPAAAGATPPRAVAEESPTTSAVQPTADSDEACPVSPQSILEAMLFVGSPDNAPLTGKQAASLMRGVRPREIDQHVQQLNAAYEAEGAPYRIVSERAGYRLVISDQYSDLRDKFYGRVKQARLSQAAVDVLAIVAYHQPATRADVDRLRGAPSGSLLTQLVRRQLLAVSRLEDRPRVMRYVTTSRFLRLFHLQSLNDLPRQEGERST